jgi:RNA polymerase sigma-70 factor (ECF subfamily)
MSRRDGEREELFNRLFDKYFRRVVRFYVVAFHLSEPDAEELAQEAFLKFYEAMEEYRGEAEWAFLETTARNLGLNRIRSLSTIKRGAIRPVDLDDPLVKRKEPAAPPEIDLADRQHQAMQSKRMHDAIAQLPSGQRQCIQLQLEDRKYDEIAAALRITVDAVKARLRDARRTLRDKLGAEGALPEDER